MAKNSAAIAAVVVVLVIAVAAIALASGHTAAAGAVSAPILLTDPPHVPAGTSALVVTYSSVQVHTEGTANSGWVSATGSGSVDLLTTVNSSKVIGYANVSANSTINVVRLVITHATITVNGTTYNVTLPNNQLTVPITGSAKVNGTTGVMIQISPRVSAVFNNNATTFVMAPAARAAVVANVSATARLGVGANVEISTENMHELEAQTANITITGASLAVNGNVTTVSVTVKNDAHSNATFNGTATLDELRVFGPQNVSVTAVAGLNASAHSEVEGELHGGRVANVMVGASLGASATALSEVGLNIQAFRTIVFQISSSGALTVPEASSDFEDGSYALAAGQSVTLTFNGTMRANDNTLAVTPKAGSQYTLTIEGEQDATATTSVMAT